jgi:hypothetical protein
MTTSQLRMYKIVDGSLDQFVEEWRERVAPLREQFGFRVVGAWTIPETNGFVWVISHDGDFEEADQAYYTSDERKAMDPDPARHIEEVDTRLMQPVEG